MQDIGYQPREGPTLQLGTDSKPRQEHNLGNDNRVKGNFPDAEGTTRATPWIRTLWRLGSVIPLTTVTRHTREASRRGSSW